MKKTSLLLAISLALTGCAGHSDERLAQREQQQIEQAQRQAKATQQAQTQELAALPEWVLTPPVASDSGFYGVGVAQSKQLNHARKAARLQAEFELAKQTNQVLSGSQRAFEQGDADGNVETQTTFLIDQIVDAVPVVGYEVVDQKMVAMNGQFHSYVLLKLPYSQFNKVLKQLRADSDNARVQRHFDELERRLAARRAQPPAQGE
ncbi:LPP20 family lipoprotein [Pseudoalteromonas rubra]|uniref:LPP20 lipoprotein n=1 Tax=Pseudoalteromonas rubra TaxID=43658 RepID=A0A0U2XE60_9GAMM|nr:LPP20 family lipoprotein [Pseudoalteromonas rubra]ALU46164.1 hypothetical protein AT705_24690 [Pseudoalteromonas rubra]